MVRSTISTQAAPETSERRISRRLFSKRIAGIVGGATLAASAPIAAVAEGTSFSSQTAPEASQTGGGQAIANFAMQYHGYPYVWAGNTPAGFDCSGFTQYVVLSVLGIDIGHGTAGQMNYGAWVEWGAWLPGDLVYFAGTFGSGVSHTGVYIGNGQFIHAENESTGVTISSIYSGYYSGHYHGAIRLA